jgi:hypothetical protein
MKKFLGLIGCLVILAAIIIPLACGNQNNAPAGPIGGGVTATFTPVITNTPAPTLSPTPTITPGGPTFTNTPTNTLVAGVNTPTFTPTFAITYTFQHNYGTTASINGMVITGSQLTVAEDDSTYGPMVEGFSIQAGGVVTPVPGQANFVWQGFPTPTTTPGEAGYVFTAVGLAGPQGFINPSGGNGYAAILDTNGAAATLYYGVSAAAAPSPWNQNIYNGWTGYGLGFGWEPWTTSGFNIVGGFKSPKGMGADTSGFIYIADTGNSRVEQFGNIIGPFHAWSGNSGAAFANGFLPVAFVSPYAVACDASTPATVYVGDNGYSPAVVEEFASGGTTITGGFKTVKGCVIHGIAVGPSPNYLVYVSDAGGGVGNGQIEIYSNGTGAYAALPVGTLLSAVSNPQGYSEAATFDPTGIGFDANGYIWVGDATNRQIVSFFN